MQVDQLEGLVEFNLILLTLEDRREIVDVGCVVRFLSIVNGNIASLFELLDLRAHRLHADGQGTTMLFIIFAVVLTHLQLFPTCAVERIFFLVLHVCFLSQFKRNMRRSIRDRHGSSSCTMLILAKHCDYLRKRIARHHERSEQSLQKVLREELLEQAGGALFNSVDHTQRQHCLHGVGICEIESLVIEPRLQAKVLCLALNKLLLGEVLQKLTEQRRVWIAAVVQAALLEARRGAQLGYRVVN